MGILGSKTLHAYHVEDLVSHAYAKSSTFSFQVGLITEGSGRGAANSLIAFAGHFSFLGDLPLGDL
eukprot:CAMPEP_0184697408 /NCGR_PEP_ID=MMETSP0313-20130426/4384_1 /TAXON_ID=2792 /ORGANISM="Porphyridium aerugineum, Strain SAG 1380-2" /LENGTH=65 /DNA_ID=CAMNT_0027156197 /DNA_START=193 /DNA_END=387 /DNA_ORIENTATION=+